MRIYIMLIVVACSCVNRNQHVPGMRIEQIPKTGLLGTKGLRVHGNFIKPVGGRISEIFEVDKLPLSGKKWPYIVEIRFVDSEKRRPLQLSTQQRSSIEVKYRFQDEVGTLSGSGTLVSDWLGSSYSSDSGAYYYLNPSSNRDYRGLYLEGGGIQVDIQIIIKSDVPDNAMCSVSLRTGGTK